MRLNLRGKFLLPTVVLIIVGMGISTAVSYYLSASALDKVVNQQVEQLVVTGTKQISSWLDERRHQVLDWSKNEILSSSLDDGFVAKSARMAATKYMVELQKEYPYLEAINLASADGIVISSSASKVIGLDIKERVYFQEAMKGKSYISDALKSKNTGKPMFVLSQPITVDGRVAGVFFSVIDISHFSKEHIASVRIGETGYAYLYGGEGVI